jgi:penicillin-binding protein 1B
MSKKILISLLLTLLLVTGSIVVYGWHLSNGVEQRFAARRWSIPSRVYSDTTLLYPGQYINRRLFQEKLLNLDYRKVLSPPTKKGEMQINAGSIRIFLNDLRTPWNNREGFPIQIVLAEGQIKNIKRTDRNEALSLLELEPEEIMLFFGPERERRRLVTLSQVPAHLIFAVLAAEDHRFYQHRGIDPRGILRALMTNLRQGSIRQGGSTLTQQLAKNYFLTPDRTLRRKLKEILLSVAIEFKYEKDEILEIYLNEIYLGQKGADSINGVGEASYFYFGKPVEDLSRSEAATIAGLIRAPNHYSPYQDKRRCRARRNSVLQAMETRGWITETELHADLRAPVTVAGYMVHAKTAPYFIDYLSEQLDHLYRPEDLTSLGLSIYTTLDTQVQKAAERALENGLIRLEESNPDLKREDPGEKLQGAIAVIQPKTGYVLAMVGGRNYSTSQFNRITQAKRQPGSAFKPFVYLAALDKFNPASMLSNETIAYTVEGRRWEPKNFEEATEPRVSMRTALKMSYNRATVDLAMRTGLDRIVAITSRFHFSTPLKNYPSLALGAFEVIPLELARAYCVFAADGVQSYPLSLKDVTDEAGYVLKQKHLKIERLISPAKAFIMTSMLESVVSEGTARSLKNQGISWPVAGKTGTTNDFRDAWFVGYTPDILTLVWVGFDNGDPIMATGSSAALPIWADLMKSIPSYISKNKFSQPPGVQRQTVCRESGMLAVADACPERLDEYFLEGRAPDEFCPLHKKSGFKDQFIKGIKNLFNEE